MVFTNKEVPSIISAAPSGLSLISQKIPNAEILCISDNISTDKEKILKVFSQKENTIVIITGKENNPDITALLSVLRIAGIKKLLSESPTYTQLLIKQEAFSNLVNGNINIAYIIKNTSPVAFISQIVLFCLYIAHVCYI